MRIAAKYVMPALSLAHRLDVGAKRLVDGVTDPTLSSGAFYASAAQHSEPLSLLVGATLLPRWLARQRRRGFAFAGRAFPPAASAVERKTPLRVKSCKREPFLGRP